MKTKTGTTIVVLALIMMGCTAPAYLPKASSIGENQYGSYIKVKRTDKPKISGELIAIDSAQMIIFNENTRICETVPMNTVRQFKLKYAKARNYGWTIPVYSLWSLTHGILATITLPSNLVVTIVTTTWGHKDFTYSKKNTTFETLKMFSRFPQGIPEGVTLTEIKQDPTISKKDF